MRRSAYGGNPMGHNAGEREAKALFFKDAVQPHWIAPSSSERRDGSGPTNWTALDAHPDN